MPSHRQRHAAWRNWALGIRHFEILEIIAGLLHRRWLEVVLHYRTLVVYRGAVGP
jgi:hypothetical protein